MVVGGGPDIFPVNFIVENGTVVFRTAEGTKMTAATHGAVAFEVDGVDAELGEAWSVVLKGEAHEVRELEDLAGLARLPLSPLTGTPKRRFVRIDVQEITGRQFPVADPSVWRNPFSLRRSEQAE